MKIRRPAMASPKGKSVKPKVDPVRKRNTELVQAEMNRLLQSVDEVKRHGSIEALDVSATILSVAYTLIDAAERMKRS